MTAQHTGSVMTKVDVDMAGQQLTVDMDGQQLTVDLAGQQLTVDMDGQQLTVDMAGQQLAFAVVAIAVYTQSSRCLMKREIEKMSHVIHPPIFCYVQHRP